jgi:hypothetical protein
MPAFPAVQQLRCAHEPAARFDVAAVRDRVHGDEEHRCIGGIGDTQGVVMQKLLVYLQIHEVAISWQNNVASVAEQRTWNSRSTES